MRSYGKLWKEMESDGKQRKRKKAMEEKRRIVKPAPVLRVLP